MRSGGACWVAVSKCLECLARSMFYSNKMAAECPYTHRLIARSISMPMHTQIDHSRRVTAGETRDPEEGGGPKDDTVAQSCRDASRRIWESPLAPTKGLPEIPKSVT